jgi:Na+-translocating ferredoxin:NAD+ oxidoreductase RnfE subunit
VTVATGIMPLITIIIGRTEVYSSITNILTTIVDGLKTAGDTVLW